MTTSAAARCCRWCRAPGTRISSAKWKQAENTTDGVGLLADVLVRRGTCPPVGKITGANAIDGQTWVVKYQPLYARVKTIADGVTLQFASLSINAAADHEDAMRFIAHSVEPFRVGELPGLRSDQQTDLARTLIVSGFLAPLNESENS